MVIEVLKVLQIIFQNFSSINIERQKFYYQFKKI